MSPQDGWGSRTLVSPDIGAVPSPPASQFQSPQPPSGGQGTSMGRGGPSLGSCGHWKEQKSSKSLYLSPAGPVLPAPSSMPQTAQAVRCVAPRGPAIGLPFLRPPPRNSQRYKRVEGGGGMQDKQLGMTCFFPQVTENLGLASQIQVPGSPLELQGLLLAVHWQYSHKCCGGRALSQSLKT